MAPGTVSVRDPTTAMEESLASCSGRDAVARAPLLANRRRRLVAARAAAIQAIGQRRGGVEGVVHSWRPTAPPAPSLATTGGARLMDRPQLDDVDSRQRAAAAGAAVFDEHDMRMAMHDVLDVRVEDARKCELNSGDESVAELAPIHCFSEIRKSRQLLRNAQKAKLNRPTPVQRYTIPAVLSGRDVLVTAPPGSGTTIAWMLPVLRQLLRRKRAPSGNRARPSGVVLAPTREAAAQLAAEVARLTAETHLKVVLVVGGTPVLPQKLQLRGGCDLLLATPGRLLGLVQDGAVSLSDMAILVLDDADALMAPQFERPMRALLAHRTMPQPGQRQTLLLAPPLPRSVALRCSAYLHDPIRIAVGANVPLAPLTPSAVALTPPSNVTQRVVGLHPKHKPRALLQALRERDGQLCVVFTNTRAVAGQVHKLLTSEGIMACELHRGASQLQRDEALQCFRFGVAPVLLTCGLGALGLDVPDVAHVINYDAPVDGAQYLRRAARTGRAGTPGLVTTLFTPQDAELAVSMVGMLRGAGQRVPEWLQQLADRQAAVASGSVAGVRQAATAAASMASTAEQLLAGDAAFAAAQGPAWGGRFFSAKEELCFGSFVEAGRVSNGPRSLEEDGAGASDEAVPGLRLPNSSGWGPTQRQSLSGPVGEHAAAAEADELDTEESIAAIAASWRDMASGVAVSMRQRLEGGTHETMAVSAQ